MVGLLSLTRNVKRAIQMHHDLSQSTQSPAELLTGCFNGIKVCNVLHPSFPYSSLTFFFQIFGQCVSTESECYVTNMWQKFPYNLQSIFNMTMLLVK